jgi:hypothetical protein
MSKLSYRIITQTVAPGRQSLTVTFNYNIHAKDLILLIEKLLAVKGFHSVSLGHFEIKKGHISDYHKNTIEQSGRDFSSIDDLDQFERDIDKSVKLDRLWKINDFLEFRELSKDNKDSEVGRINTKFGKRTNEFFVL